VCDVGGDVHQRLGHELSDVLWSAIVIAAECGIDLEASFVATMDEIEVGLENGS
jgi:NTP pyrophosphatase (non-canonical NTP hydrolase)